MADRDLCRNQRLSRCSAAAIAALLALDDGVIQAARVLARQQGSSLGAVISAQARRALNTPSGPAAMEQQTRNGLPLLPVQPQGAPVDLELVNSLRDALAQGRPRSLSPAARD
ncbi:MAG: hypothetical protein VKI42_04860 [Synechococcaceae cyanobacterium]|nr:hypothetical protein [Synechococcaceae cyanobacterium]